MPTIKEGDIRDQAVERLKYIIEKLENKKAPFVTITVDTNASIGTGLNQTGEEEMRIGVEGMKCTITTPVYIEKGGE